MSKPGFSQLSRKKIVMLSEQWLEEIPCLLFPNKYLDVDLLLNVLTKQYGVVYKEANLGMSAGHKLLGAMVPETQHIYIDVSLNHVIEMKRFTQVHEIAHWILHRHISLDDYSLTDTPKTLDMKRRLVTTYDWVEWQANTYAACLLMPEKRFKNECLRVCDMLNLKYSPEMSPANFYKLSKVLAYTFQVSMTAAGIHLKHSLQMQQVG